MASLDHSRQRIVYLIAYSRADTTKFPSGGDGFKYETTWTRSLEFKRILVTTIICTTQPTSMSPRKIVKRYTLLDILTLLMWFHGPKLQKLLGKERQKTRTKARVKNDVKDWSVSVFVISVR